MGRRGPAPTPTKQKIAAGETRPSRVNYAEPQPRIGLPRMPSDMTDGAKSVWKHVIAEMGASEVITGADRDVLRLYCEAVDRYVRAQRLFARSSVLLNRAGLLVKNPLHQVVRDNADQVRLLSRELGLSPSARAGLMLTADNGGTSIDDELGPPPRLKVVGGAYE